jgi:hypothetical protein
MLREVQSTITGPDPSVWQDLVKTGRLDEHRPEDSRERHRIAEPERV